MNILMYEIIREEYDKAVIKRDEIREVLHNLETDNPEDRYNITITRDRLAYWEGRTEGLKFALDNISATGNK
jgi:hypothetical protein